MRFSFGGERGSRSDGAGSTGRVEKDMHSKLSFSALRQGLSELIYAAQPISASKSLSVTKGRAAKMTTSIFSLNTLPRCAAHICARWPAVWGCVAPFTHSAFSGVANLWMRRPPCHLAMPRERRLALELLAIVWWAVALLLDVRGRKV